MSTPTPIELKYDIQNQIELNFSYMPFIKGGGLFVPTNKKFQLGDAVMLELHLPGHAEIKHINGNVVWITPANSLYQIYPGIGVQFTGENAKNTNEMIQSNLDNKLDVGGYAYGIANTSKT